MYPEGILARPSALHISIYRFIAVITAIYIYIYTVKAAYIDIVV